MGFRNPVTSAVDTGDGGIAGVRLYQNRSNPAVPRGVAEWRTGYMGRNATVSLSGAISGGSAFVLDGGRYQGIDAPELQLNVESLPGGGYGPVARVSGAALSLDGGVTGLAYARLRMTATTSGGASAWVVLPMQVADLDPYGGYNPGGFISRWTVPPGQAGIYDVSGEVVFAASAANPVRNARIIVNAAVFPGCAGEGGQRGVGAGVAASTSVKVLQLNVGDFVEVQGFSDAAWSTATFADAASNLQILRVR